MANEKILKILNQGVEACNKWREEIPEIKPDLYAADLECAELLLRIKNVITVDNMEVL